MSKRDAKFFLISVIIHYICLSLIFFLNVKKTKKLIYFSVQGGGKSEIVPKTQNGKIVETKKGYYGIGIYTNFRGAACGNRFMHGYVVDSVKSGYGADASGLMKGDIILSVNGVSTALGDKLRGKRPKTLLLTICRNGVIVNVSVQRSWVSTN